MCACLIAFLLIAGTCKLPASALQGISYDTCAVDGGAALVNGTLVDLGRAQFTYTPASCNYTSESETLGLSPSGPLLNAKEPQ